LIEGAHEGHGLGDRFLGHIERTSVLLHLIDCTQDDIAGAYQTIRTELEEYGHEVGDKDEIIALTKIDALGEELAREQAKALESVTNGAPIHLISGVSGAGIKEILFLLADHVRAFKQSELESFGTPDNLDEDFQDD
jgi:GTP-binding protein